MVCHNREQFVNFIFHTVFNTMAFNLVLAGGKIYQVKVNMVRKKHTQEINK